MTQCGKNALRRELQEVGKALTREYMLEAGQTITAHILQSEPFHAAKRIFTYLSTEREPDTRWLIEAALQQGKEIYVPGNVCCGRMEAVRYTRETVLKSGAYGIEEPVAGAAYATVPMDLVLVPCISAGRDGWRLGHGGGYYDRYLASSRARRMCLCFEALRREGLPMEENDVRMEYLVTEQGVFRCGDGGRNI